MFENRKQKDEPKTADVCGFAGVGRRITETEADMYSVAEAADRMGMRERDFRSAMGELGIPLVRVGYRILIPIVAFENWLREEEEGCR